MALTMRRYRQVASRHCQCNPVMKRQIISVEERAKRHTLLLLCLIQIHFYKITSR
jgi:hypothetical protein